MSRFNKLHFLVNKRLIAATFVVGYGLAMAVPALVHAATTAPGVTNPTAAARVSFSFDDGLASAYTQAAPTLAKYGLSGTNYIITDCAGMTTVPNTCRANTDAKYMTWAQIQALQNSYGWEIGSHTADHKCLASNATIDPGDCQKNTLTTAQVDKELSDSKTALANHGISATDFAPPYGDYSPSVLAEIAKYYATMRGFKDQGNNVWPLDDYLLNDMTVQETTNTVANVEAKINQAIASNTWLVLTFHDIQAKPSTKPNDYQYGTAELDKIAAYVKAKQTAGQLQSVHINQGLVTSSTNLLPNGSFGNGVATGWTTPNPANVTKDTANHGSAPYPTDSIKFVAGTTPVRLYSPHVNVNSNTTYMLKSFLNLATYKSGDIEYYVDEYDANGNWISGQYKKHENSVFVEDMNFAYTPSSSLVASADLQITVAANSGITAYIDNAQWFPLTATAAATNLMPNEGFDDGIADGWSTDDSARITKDSASHGSPNNPVNSIRLVNGTAANGSHLFSPKIAVSSANSYTLQSYLNLTTITSGEVGFYIDEYDASGNWISGQYKTGVRAVSAGNVGLTYQPSSSTVKSASLQIIVAGNSGITAYFDDVRWSQN